MGMIQNLPQIEPITVLGIGEKNGTHDFWGAPKKNVKSFQEMKDVLSIIVPRYL